MKIAPFFVCEDRVLFPKQAMPYRKSVACPGASQHSVILGLDHSVILGLDPRMTGVRW